MAASSGKKKSKGKKKPPVKKPAKSKLGLFIWGAVAGITLIALVGILLLPAKKETLHERDSTVKPYPRPDLFTEKPRKPVYEERIGIGFDLRVWEADMAILHALSRMDKDDDHILHSRIENRFFYGTPYQFQDLHVYTNNRQSEFISILQDTLALFVDNASLKLEDESQHHWSISINGQNTHLLRLGIDPPLTQPGSGKLAIIIDDLGESTEYARKLAELDFPVTFSILPYLPETQKVAQIASRNNLEIMLHMPMEPESYSRGVEPGPGALFVDMEPHEIRMQFLHSLSQVPQATGVNNHMGSAFTQNYSGMKIVFEELQKREMFFVDSLTTPRSVAAALAAEMEVDFMQRHVFLDNIRSQEAIIYQLKKAETMAARYGHAVAIGHPHPETLQALRSWNRERNPRVYFSRVDDLLLDQKIKALSADTRRKTDLIY